MTALTKITGINKTKRTRWLAHIHRSFELVSALVLLCVVAPDVNGLVQWIVVHAVAIPMFMTGVTKWANYLCKRIQP